jgi:serine/threonine protein kinase
MTEGRTTDDAFPREFGRYTLLAPLAQGGMGEVCLALAGELAQAQRLCVVKTIRAEYANAAEFVSRFLDEGRVLCALTHPNIGQILEVGVDGSTPFVAMEFVGGVDLDALVYTCRETAVPVPTDFALALVAGVLDGMDYAHRATTVDGTRLALVHRDISPQNLRVSWEGDVKVLDFGTALAEGRGARTAHGLVFGKPGYMSPEQARGERVDARTDLFAVGVVLWEMLAGRDFAQGELAAHMEAVARNRHRFDPPSSMRRDTPPGLDGWFAQMTAFEPARRFPDAASARRALGDLCHAGGVRLERAVLSSFLVALYPHEQAREQEHIKQLVAAGRARRAASPAPQPAPLRHAQTEPLGHADASLLRGTRYRMGARIGVGGMGEVFAAEHIDLGRTVAIKVLFADKSADGSVAQRFKQEARAIAALQHPNIVHVYDLGSTEDGRLFYAMERLLGQTLRERLDALRAQGQPTLAPEEMVRIGRGVAAGLGAAHAVGVVHRDIKPENIFLCDDGGIKVLDFGIAKANNKENLASDKHLTRAGEIFGTPAYMAPEQGRGAPVDARTDLYSLGAVLYECATGHELFEGSTVVETLVRHMVDAPIPPRTRAPAADIPAKLEAVILRCLAKEPDARPDSAATLGLLLAQSLTAPSVPAPAVAPAPVVAPAAAPVASAPRPSRTVMAALVVTGVLLSLGGAAVLLRPTPTPAARAESPTPVAPRNAPEDTPARVEAPVQVAAPVQVPAAPMPPPEAPDAAAEAPPAPAPVPTPAPVAEAPAARAESHYTLAQRAFRRRRYDEAVQHAEVAISSQQRPTDARILLGRAYMALHDRDRALRQWRMVLSQHPGHAEATQLLRAADAAP